MKQSKTRIFFLGIALLGMFLSFRSVYADNIPPGVGYQVEPIFSKEQIDPDKGFYYLKTVPNSEQFIEAEIMSTQEEPVTITMSVLDSFTQNNGQMGYTSDKNELDETLKEPLSSFIEVSPASITVQKFEKKIVRFKLNTPKESYEGVKAGALLFSKEDADAKGITSKNEFRIGVLISESGDSYSDSASLNLLEAKGTLKEAKKTVSLKLQNPEPKLLANLTMEANIKEKKTGKTIKTKQVKDYLMAPNSHFELDLDWGISKLPAGDFVATVEANNGEHSWSLTKDFTISGKLANDINHTSPYQIVTPTWIKVMAVGLGVSEVAVCVVIIGRRKKREKALKKMKRGKNKKKGR